MKSQKEECNNGGTFCHYVTDLVIGALEIRGKEGACWEIRKGGEFSWRGDYWLDGGGGGRHLRSE